jgi:hypothetical protein
MEFNNSLDSHTLVKRERSPGLEQVPDAPSPKRQADETSGVACAPFEFPWRTCDELGDVERLKIKEQAVILAEKYCDRIRTVLGAVLSTPKDSPEAIMMGLRIVNHWCAEHG